MSAPLIAIADLEKTYATRARPRVQALAAITLDIAAGEFVTIVGQSGCGKTTLLKILAGLLPCSGGRVTLRGAVVDGPSRDIGIVFQDPVLLPWRTAFDNVMLPVQVLRLDPAVHRDRARRLLALVGLAGFEDKYPHELSGGMRQRVALARALAEEPDVLLMDEPFAALDAMTRDLLHDELERLWAETGTTLIFVTHNVREAVRLGDRVVVLSSRPGRVAVDVPIDLPRPRRLESPAVATLAGEVTEHLRAEVRKHGH